jgi:hypothetical protein
LPPTPVYTTLPDPPSAANRSCYQFGSFGVLFLCDDRSKVPARVTLKNVNDELARLGFDARLAKGSGYFYFWTGEAAEWLDRIVQVERIGQLNLEQWIEEFRRLQKHNSEILRMSAGKTPRPAKKSPGNG